MESSKIPEFDFNPTFSLSPLPTFSPLQASSSDCVGSESAPVATEQGNAAQNRLPEQSHHDVRPMRAQPASTLPAMQSPRPTRRDEPLDVEYTEEDEDEDEDLRLALANSVRTAEEEKERRYHGFSQHSIKIPPPYTEPAPLMSTPPSYDDHTTQVWRFSQTSPTSHPHASDSPFAHPGSPLVSPLSTASQTTDDHSGIRKSSSRSTRRPSNSYRPQRIPISPSPPPLDAVQRSPPKLEVPDSDRQRRSSRSSGKLSIRDTSRSRRGSTSIKSTNNSSGELCNLCNNVGPARSYCNVCHCVYCDPCWDKIPPHRINVTMGQLPHEKTDQHIAQKVKDVLTPDLDESARERLHAEDVDTTWFGIVREEHELPLFRDYGRYATLIAGAKDLRLDLVDTRSAYSDQNETLYPSLISFVGETGAGKSTLIKLLIDLGSEPDEKFPTPVVGAPGKDVPTSEDVHLYLDPDSSMSSESQAPLLFADCEGLEGGERDPIGARLKKRLERKSCSGHRRQVLRHTSERELIWADTDKTKTRGFAVAHLYPRLLYTFSDVIVFVLKNPRVIESVLERLVEWAQAALEKSSNQPVLPHAIIALNACDNDTPQDLWDVDNATIAILESLSMTVSHNTTFKKLTQFWRERDRHIETVEQLLLSYYSSIHVVRIPTTGRPNLIQSQVEKLAEKIRTASKQARETKLELRMLLDADEFQPYLQVAFDHFALDLDTPFDFVQASFTNSPIPNDFGGNILKLGLQIMERWKDLAKGETIFEELSYVVASCIMLDNARAKSKGKPDAIFPMYLAHIDNALENFCDRHWPCEFVSKGGRCVNVRSGHGAKGHQLKSGKLLEAGDYFSSFTFDGYKSQFQESTYYKLVRLHDLIRTKARDSSPSITEEKAAADIHREMVLPNFFEHASRGDPQAFLSHTVCFCCLFEPPEHALPCGHIICTACLKTYGKSHLSRYVEIAECPMEKRPRRFRFAWRVYLKPSACGVRILTLDGGGVRGIVELEILRAIERELGGGIPVQNFFDLIVGTSTGGIIALGLTVRNWTIAECISKFEALCFRAFTQRKGSNVFGVGWIVENYHHSKYETQPLEEALTEAFGEDQYLFGGRRSEIGSLDIKVAVTATSVAGSGVVLANYNRLCHEKLPYSFQRPESLDAELKTWEAARATSAAPKYFKPMVHTPSKQVYTDGGIYYNNPIEVADRERKLIWPAMAGNQEDEPDIMLSIGTFFCDTVSEKRATAWSSYTPRGIIAHGRHLTKMAQDHIHSSLNSEQTWRRFLQVKAPIGAHREKHIRINPELDDRPPKLDAKERMKEMQSISQYRVGEDPQIKSLACRLVAACFYLDIEGDVKENSNGGTLEVSGFFHCRFMTGFEVTALGEFIKRKAVAGHDPHFLIKEEGNEVEQPQEARITTRVLERMIHSQVFRMERLEIRRPTRHSRTALSLCFTRDTSYPISGFPRRLHADRPIVQANRHVLTSSHSYRWAGRTNSQQLRRMDWKPPNTLSPLGQSDIIDRYAHSSHLLGNATRELHMDVQSQAVGTTGIQELAGSNSPTELSGSGISVNSCATELPTTEVQADRYFVALNDWDTAQSNTLKLKRGDFIKISNMTDDEWWFGVRPVDQASGWIIKTQLVPVEAAGSTRPTGSTAR